MIKLTKFEKCIVVEKLDKNENKKKNRNKYRLIIRETKDGYKNIRFVENN